MSGWIRLDIESTFAGWTSRLSEAEYGAWVKLMLVIKLFGARGEIETDKLMHHLEHAGSSLESIKTIAGKSDGRVILTDDVCSIKGWAFYQLDLDSAQRQRRTRDKHNTPPDLIPNDSEVFVRDGYRCRYCGSKDEKLTVDHIIPRCQGGNGAISNLVTACWPCNNKKSGRTPEQAGMSLKQPPVTPVTNGGGCHNDMDSDGDKTGQDKTPVLSQSLQSLIFKVIGAAMPTDLTDEIRLHGEPEVKAAITKAHGNGKHGASAWPYAKGILHNRAQEGYPPERPARRPRPDDIPPPVYHAGDQD